MVTGSSIEGYLTLTGFHAICIPHVAERVYSKTLDTHIELRVYTGLKGQENAKEGKTIFRVSTVRRYKNGSVKAIAGVIKRIPYTVEYWKEDLEAAIIASTAFYYAQRQKTVMV